MFGRSLRKLFAALSMALGALLVMAIVDVTPVIGSPQIDYPSFDVDLLFWPQLALLWVAYVGGGILLAGLGMLAWSNEPTARVSLAQTVRAAVFWFAVISGVKLASFLAWGTMGPLDVPQPIVRFALTNGLISAALITLAWLAAGRALQGLKTVGPSRRGVSMLLVTSATFSLAIIALALGAGLPMEPLIAYWWPFVAIIAVVSGLLASFTWRVTTPTTQERPQRVGSGS